MLINYFFFFFFNIYSNSFLKENKPYPTNPKATSPKITYKGLNLKGAFGIGIFFNGGPKSESSIFIGSFIRLII